MQLNLFASLFTRVYTYNQNGQKIVPRGNEHQDFLSRPGSWQSSWHVPSLLDVHFSFLEVDFQTPKFILLSHETGSLPRLTSPQLFLFRILKELCHRSPELMLGNGAIQLPAPLYGTNLVLIKAFGTFFPQIFVWLFLLSHYPILC